MSNFDDIFMAAAKQREEEKENFIKESKENREKCYQMADNKAKEIATSGTQLQAYLDTQVKFPMHTPNNVLLIMQQRPDAIQIGDPKYWKEKHLFVKKEELGNPILIMEPGEKYTREDNSVGTYYNAKKTYDITQTTAKYINRQDHSYDINELITAIAKNSPIPFNQVGSAELPEGKGALYDPQIGMINLRQGMENGTAIFQVVTMELSHALLAQGNPDYDRNVNALTAFASSYMLCKKYGVDTKAYHFSEMNSIFPDMESNEIKQELYTIKRTAKDLAQKLDKDLKRQKAPVEKSHEVR